MSNSPKARQKQEITAMKAEMYSGPLPHPDIIRQYDEISPGAAEKIFDSFVRQNEHRIEMESRVVKDSIFRAKLGLVMSFILSLICLYIAYKLFNTDKGSYGFGLILVNIAALVSVFYRTATKKEDELSNKRDNLDKLK